jgi:hypothetical protein
MLLDVGVCEAARGCLFVYGHHRFDVSVNSIEGGTSKVDYLVVVDNSKVALCEAESPSIMHSVGEELPERGIELAWSRGQSLTPKVLTKASTTSHQFILVFEVFV